MTRHPTTRTPVVGGCSTGESAWRRQTKSDDCETTKPSAGDDTPQHTSAATAEAASAEAAAAAGDWLANLHLHDQHIISSFIITVVNRSSSCCSSNRREEVEEKEEEEEEEVVAAAVVKEAESVSQKHKS